MESSSRPSIYFSIIIAAVVGALVSFFLLSTKTQLRVPGPMTPTSTPFSDSERVQEGIANLRDEEAATISVVRRVSPSVVSIGIFKEQRRLQSQTGPTPFDDLFFFGAPFAPAPSEKNSQPGEFKKVQVGGGTGFIIEKDGMVLTNRHVVADMDAEYHVMLADRRSFIATVLARDPVNDLAVLKIDAKGLPAVSLGDSDSILIGQTVIAIGNALSEFENTVTRGIVSGINRRVVAGDGLGSSEVIEEALQTDAAINPGNSGGPLINLKGEVIGINTAISREGQSVGFAIPINIAKRAIESVKKHGTIVRPWLGVRYVMITPELAEAKQLSTDHGALILSGDRQNEPAILPDSPAAKAGLLEGDIILSVNGAMVAFDTPLARVLSEFSPGDVVTLRVQRKKEVKEIRVTLGTFK